MSGKMKKLICALLTGTMILSSASMLAFAAPEEETASDATVTATSETEATAATEATEAPAATEATEAPAAEEATEAPAAEPTNAPAPIAEGTKYDSDSYYQKALALCQGLGIITGYEDGSIKPESTVTRAEMAAIVLRTLNVATTSSYQNIFTDVASSHWAANTIQTASAFGVINGMGDGTFLPDGNVLYEQVAKMLVCAMNYHETAAYYGGYPNGHIKVAGDLGITKNATGNNGVAAERGLVIKMVYNTLLALYNEPDGSEYGQSKYKAEKTLAEYAFDVKEGKGVLIGTAMTSLTDKEYNNGQVGILVEDKTTAVKTEEKFTTALTGLEGMLASNITFYYAEEKGNDIKTLLAIAENTAKTVTTEISRDDIADAEEAFTGFDNPAAEGTIKLRGKSAYKIEANPLVIYNGSLITYDEYTDAQTANTKKDDSRFYDSDKNPINYNDFLKPAVGTIRMVDNDTNGKYDTIFIDSYETLLVASASTKSVTGKINNAAASINVDETASDLTITTTINGIEAAPRNLKKNNVVSLKRSLDGETLEFVCTGESFTGAVQSFSAADKTVVIGGTEYDVDANAMADCEKIGVQGIFYTDMFDRIGYVESSAAGRLQSGEAYGWLMGAYRSDNGDDVLVKIMTQDGKAEEYKFASSVDFWEPCATATSKKTKESAETAIMNILNNDTFPHVWVGERMTDKYLSDGVSRPYKWTKSYSIRLVKYRANTKGELSRLYGAVNVVNEAKHYYDANDEHVSGGYNIKDPYIDDATIAALKTSDALIVDMSNKSGSTLVGGMTGGYLITDDMIEFKVPNTLTNASKASAYTVSSVVSSTYNQRENGLADDWLVADMDGANPAVIIRYVADTSVPGNPADMDNVGNRSAMVVEKILKGMDADDNTVYTIVGTVSGSEMSVTTNGASSMAELTGYVESGRKYGVGEILWDADKNFPLTDVLHKGDIIISDGTNILLYSCVEDLYNNMKAGNDISKYVAGSNTRNYFKFDKVTNYEIDDPAQLTIGSETFSMDASKAMTTVEIDLAKPSANAEVLKEVSNIADLYTDGSDYAFARFADKGALQEIIIYRFLNIPEAE